ncbi:hypothetical protein DPMN_027555 [Dreissena polymorpha]|uniref:Uncharacterized protein n=1 Tax=Dreissena polymorpha TaxID=45954 RepID=A0A9D4LUK6_DREPO|nr:hypothetical protein DPMN_027555 [Dreissena polymorpha]
MAHHAATAHWLISLTGTHIYTWVERSRCGTNFLLKEITVVMAVFESRTSRSLSQRPTIRPLLPIRCNVDVTETNSYTQTRLEIVRENRSSILISNDPDLDLTRPNVFQNTS